MTVSFAEHVSLLNEFLGRRQPIVDRIESTLLNVKDKDAARRRDHAYFSQLLNACFFGVGGLPHDLLRLKGQLAARHLADGFEPVVLERFSHELDPVELIVRAYVHWEEHRWPGKSARLTYAHAIYAVFIVRQLEYLSLTIWDDGEDVAADHLDTVQQLLERLNQTASLVFSRRSEWLMQTAQGPLTRHLEPYFRISERIDASLAERQRLELHKAGARLAGGHLRAQLRYRVWTSGRPADDPELLAFLRNANSMDMALLVRDLVPLLQAYKTACAEQKAGARLELTDAILQGVSADPELCLVRLDLLGPSTMIEELFVQLDGPRANYTAAGLAHLDVLRRYRDLIAELAAPLHEDAAALAPSADAYSPYGIAYGFVADLMANMAVSVLHGQSSFGLTLEDAFDGHARSVAQLSRAKAWQALPVAPGEREHFDHSSEWAAVVWTRLTQALEARAEHPADGNASEVRAARIFVTTRSNASEAAPQDVATPGAASAQTYCFTSDLASAVENGATPQPKNQILRDRQEGRFLASAECSGKWFAVSKIILTVFTGQGTDAVIASVPAPVIEVMRLTCPDLWKSR